MGFDTIFDEVGSFGLYQFLLYIMFGLSAMIGGMQEIVINFIGGEQVHWCNIPRLQEFPHNLQKHVAIPKDGDGYSQCHFYDYPYDNLTNEEILNWNRSSLEGLHTKACTTWIYDQSVFVSTIISKFDLVCHRSWLNQFSSTIYMAGGFVGGLSSGIASDKIGRYQTYIIGLVVNIAVGLAAPFVQDYMMFIIIRFLWSLSSYWSYLAGFVLLIELTGPSHHVALGVFYQIFNPAGYMVMSGIAYFIRDFTWLQLVIALSSLSLLMLIGIIPKSPRWLITQGRTKEAETILNKICIINKNHPLRNFALESETTNNEPDDQNSSKSHGRFSDLFCSNVLLYHLLVVYFIWFTASLVYYGLSLNAADFGDVFLNTFLSGLIELPANLLCFLCLKKVGRRPSNILSLLIGGVFCLACIPVVAMRPDMRALLTTFSTIGKGAITFTFSTVYVYSAELFHTPVRNLVIGTAVMVSSIASMISPYVGHPFSKLWAPGPSLLFGAISVICGVTCLLLPETKGFNLPDTKDEAEAIARCDKTCKMNQTSNK